jgi:demethylmenaquinone methyltransferase/2-methoxy-6-polyprenyl-1,4-benzoquinol methylase
MRSGSVLPTGEAKVAAVDAMFDAIAPRYDLCNRVISLGLDTGWRRRTVRALGLNAGATVLDLACGTGDLCRELRRVGLVPVGVDRSAGMLAAALGARGVPDNAAARGVPDEAAAPAPLVRGDALSLPLRPGVVDGLVCGFALRNFASLPPVFAECARVVRPGGVVAFLEVDTPPSAVLRAGHRVWFGGVVPLIGGLLSDGAAYRYLPRSVAYLPPPAELAGMLTGAGFTSVARTRLSGGLAQLVTAVRE